MAHEPLEPTIIQEDHTVSVPVAEQVTLRVLPEWEQIFPPPTLRSAKESDALSALASIRLCVSLDSTISDLEEQVRRAYLPRCCACLSLPEERIHEALESAHIRYTASVLDPQCTLRALRLASGTTLRWLRIHDPESPEASAAAVELQTSAPQQRRRRTTVQRLEPNTGLTSGGARVLVFGEHFPPVARVRFGRVVVSANRISAQCLSCIAPAHEPGVVCVEVSTRATTASEQDAWTHDRVTYTYVGYERLSMILAVHAAERRAATALTETQSPCRSSSEPLSWLRRDPDDEDRR